LVYATTASYSLWYQLIPHLNLTLYSQFVTLIDNETKYSVPYKTLKQSMTKIVIQNQINLIFIWTLE